MLFTGHTALSRRSFYARAAVVAALLLLVSWPSLLWFCDPTAVPSDDSAVDSPAAWGGIGGWDGGDPLGPVLREDSYQASPSVSRVGSLCYSVLWGSPGRSTSTIPVESDETSEGDAAASDDAADAADTTAALNNASSFRVRPSRLKLQSRLPPPRRATRAAESLATKDEGEGEAAVEATPSPAKKGPASSTTVRPSRTSTPSVRRAPIGPAVALALGASKPLPRDILDFAERLANETSRGSFEVPQQLRWLPYPFNLLTKPPPAPLASGSPDQPSEASIPVADPRGVVYMTYATLLEQELAKPRGHRRYVIGRPHSGFGNRAHALRFMIGFALATDRILIVEDDRVYPFFPSLFKLPVKPWLSSTYAVNRFRALGMMASSLKRSMNFICWRRTGSLTSCGVRYSKPKTLLLDSNYDWTPLILESPIPKRRLQERVLETCMGLAAAALQLEEVIALKLKRPRAALTQMCMTHTMTHWDSLCSAALFGAVQPSLRTALAGAKESIGWDRFYPASSGGGDGGGGEGGGKKRRKQQQQQAAARVLLQGGRPTRLSHTAAPPSSPSSVRLHLRNDTRDQIHLQLQQQLQRPAAADNARDIRQLQLQPPPAAAAREELAPSQLQLQTPRQLARVTIPSAPFLRIGLHIRGFVDLPGRGRLDSDAVKDGFWECAERYITAAQGAVLPPSPYHASDGGFEYEGGRSGNANSPPDESSSHSSSETATSAVKQGKAVDDDAARRQYWKSRTLIFVASDIAGARPRVRKRLGHLGAVIYITAAHRMIHSNALSKFHNIAVNDMKIVMTDWLLLSESHFVFGTAGSSFADSAAEHWGVPFVAASLDGKKCDYLYESRWEKLPPLEEEADKERA